MLLRKWTLKFQNKFFSFGSLSVLVNSILNCLIMYKTIQNSYIIWSVNGNLVHVITKIDSLVLDLSPFWLIRYQNLQNFCIIWSVKQKLCS